jgi:hypothetical protein
MGHAVELWKVERLDPLHTAFGEHFEFGDDHFGTVQAAKRNEDETWEALQSVRETLAPQSGQKLR